MIICINKQYSLFAYKYHLDTNNPAAFLCTTLKKCDGLCNLPQLTGDQLAMLRNMTGAIRPIRTVDEARVYLTNLAELLEKMFGS